MSHSPPYCRPKEGAEGAVSLRPCMSESDDVADEKEVVNTCLEQLGLAGARGLRLNTVPATWEGAAAM